MAEKKGKKQQDAAYQPRDSGTGKPGRGSGGKRQAENVTRHFIVDGKSILFSTV